MSNSRKILVTILSVVLIAICALFFVVPIVWIASMDKSQLGHGLDSLALKFEKAWDDISDQHSEVPLTDIHLRAEIVPHRDCQTETSKQFEGGADTDDAGVDVQHTACSSSSTLEVVNTDLRPIRILRVVVNGRTGERGCDITSSQVLRTGDSWAPELTMATALFDEFASCGQIVRVDVMTDRGPVGFQFNQ